MEATELMIKDWVRFFDSCYQVESIETIHPEASVGLKDYGCELAAHCEPIPLIPEILEKNPKVAEWGYWDKEDNLFRLFAMPCINLWTVDRLQHALRLCGLDELADNFKI